MYANSLKYLFMNFINWAVTGNFKLCLIILTCYNAITRVDKPSFYTTRLNQI